MRQDIQAAPAELEVVAVQDIDVELEFDRETLNDVLAFTHRS